MGKKEYSRLGEIPRGSAGEALTEGCLVLEGGPSAACIPRDSWMP